jgi:small subunit ribosomal protein S3
VNIEEMRKPEVDAQLIADSITQQLEKRIMFRRAMKRAMQNAMRLGAQGIKIMTSGRLNGIEIARYEWYREGRVPLHTLRPTSTTASPKPRPPTASSASRCGSTAVTAGQWRSAGAQGRRPSRRRRPSPASWPAPGGDRRRVPWRGRRGGDRCAAAGRRRTRPKPADGPKARRQARSQAPPAAGGETKGE